MKAAPKKDFGDRHPHASRDHWGEGNQYGGKDSAPMMGKKHEPAKMEMTSGSSKKIRHK